MNRGIKIGKWIVSPFLIIIILLMAYQSLGSYSSPGEWFMYKLITLPGIVIGLSFHEFAHAFAAYKMGDPTAKNQGRLTINPLAHIDPFGFVSLLFLGFGWGVAVQYNPYNFKNRRTGEIVVGLAGVTMNLILGIIFGGIYVFLRKQGYTMSLGSGLGNIFTILVYMIFQINLVLCVFNLLPVPPLDGFGVLDALFNFKESQTIVTLRRHGFWILMILICLGVVGSILSPIVNWLMRTIIGIFA